MKYFLVLVLLFGTLVTPSYAESEPTTFYTKQREIDGLKRSIASVEKHNSFLEKAAKQVTQLTLSAKNSTEQKEVVVDNTEKIGIILLGLKTYDVHPYRSGHACSGHLKISFKINNESFELSFDHGDMIKSNFLNSDHFMPKEQCELIIKEAKNLGFSDSLLGIHPKKSD